MKKGKYFFGTIAGIIIILITLSGCEKPADKQSGLSFDNISFRNIPGVTAEEIAAIEALREQNRSFVYGMMLSTEAFLDKDGEARGYAALLCKSFHV